MVIAKAFGFLLGVAVYMVILEQNTALNVEPDCENQCHAHATCGVDNTLSCACNEGWYGNGVTCYKAGFLR